MEVFLHVTLPAGGLPGGGPTVGYPGVWISPLLTVLSTLFIGFHAGLTRSE